MEVTVVDENDSYIDLSPYATTSLFDAQGLLLANALATLSSLTAANRVHRYRRYRKPSLLSLLFKPKYIMKPPVHQRRTIHNQPYPDRRISIQNQPRRTPRTSPYLTPANKQPKQNNTFKPATQSKPQNNSSQKPGNSANQNRPASNNSKPVQSNNKPTQGNNKPAQTHNNKPAQSSNKPSSNTGSKQSVTSPAKGVKPSVGKTVSETKPSSSRSSHSGTSRKGK